MTDQAQLPDHSYFEELTAALTGAGFSADRAATTIADLAGYLAESGTAALEEFGPVERFAARLSTREPSGDDGEPAPDADTWRWSTDIYADRRLLNAYGAQGWEVERIDRTGQFVCRRAPGTAMRWEYRRERADDAAERARRTAELAPEGWEPCGEWRATTYYKRPVAATTGAAARLRSVPPRPGGRLFLSRKTLGVLICALLILLAAAVLIGVTGLDVTAPPFLIGACLGAVGGGWLAVRGISRDLADGVES